MTQPDHSPSHIPVRQAPRRVTPVGATVSAALLVLLAGVVPPIGTRAAVAAIHGYQATLSPVLAAAGLRCRFTTSCSRYAETVIARDGVLRGGWKAAARLARCGPWTPAGTVDDP